MTDSNKELTSKEISEMDPPFKNAHNALRRIEKSIGEKDLYFVLEKHYHGRKGGYIPKFKL